MPKVTLGCGVNIRGSWDIAKFAQRAEALGFDRITMGEHIMDNDPPHPTVLSLPALAAAAGATKTLRLMTAIVLVPLYSPIMLAKEVATVDVVSGGRLDLGIGVGGQIGTNVEFEALGVSTRTRGRRTDEMIKVMKRLWAEERVSHSSVFFSFNNVTLLPRPVQKPHPPIWVGGRSDAAMRRAATLCDGWYPSLFTLRRLRASNDAIKQVAAEVGRDLTDFHWGVNQYTAVATTREKAMANATAGFARRGETSTMSAEDMAKAFSVAGTPEECVNAIHERIDAGSTEFTFSFLGEDSAGVDQQMELFSKRVLPHFK